MSRSLHPTSFWKSKVPLFLVKRDLVSYKENEKLNSREGERKEKNKKEKADKGAVSWPLSDIC